MSFVAKTCIKFLDHRVTINGIERDPDKIEKIKNWLRGYKT